MSIILILTDIVEHTFEFVSRNFTSATDTVNRRSME
jgi:hypothetical protein